MTFLDKKKKRKGKKQTKPQGINRTPSTTIDMI